MATNLTRSTPQPLAGSFPSSFPLDYTVANFHPASDGDSSPTEKGGLGKTDKDENQQWDCKNDRLAQ